jgi:hypothetical protein
MTQHNQKERPLTHGAPHLIYNNLETGWPENPPPELPVLAQIEGLGKVFHVNIAPSHEFEYILMGENEQAYTITCETYIYEERVIRVLQFLNEQTGLVGFKNLDELPETISPSDYQRVPIRTLTEQNRTDMENDLLNVLKHGASKPFFDLDAKIRARGGDPNFRAPKSKLSGWFFKREKQIYKRKKK